MLGGRKIPMWVIMVATVVIVLIQQHEHLIFTVRTFYHALR